MTTDNSTGNAGNAPAPETAKKETAKKERKIKEGDSVRFVHAHAPGGAVDAVVTKVGKGGLVDLEFAEGEETVTITKAPFDAAGKTPDSWSFKSAE